MEISGDQGIQLRKPGEQDNDYNNQPHVIGFPDRPDGFIHRVGGLVFIPVRGEQLDDTSAEISSAEQQIKQERGP